MSHRILIVEDEPLIANDLKQIILDLRYQIVGIAYNMEKACNYIDANHVDLVLIDIHIKGKRTGIDLAQWINEKYRIPFIYITSFSDKTTLDKAKETMPAAYIVKPFTVNDIFASIELATFKSSQQDSSLDFQSINEKCKVNLSQKEYEVLIDLIKGLSGPQIAIKHFISINTVKTHTKSIYSKLGVHSRGQVVAKILR